MSASSSLARGDGAGKTLYFDCSSGLSGDMFVSALLDLGVPLSVLEDALSRLPLRGYRMRTERQERRSMMVTRFFVDVEEGEQPHRHYSDIRDMIDTSSIADGARALALRIFENLAIAEAKVHGAELDHVHFHEVGAVDSIVDIVGAAAAFDYLGARVVCGPIPLGCGFVETRHGVLPLPAPAVLELVAGLPVEGTEIRSELTTPTGAAIAKTVAASFGRIPPMVVERTGLGAGERSHPTRPGVLRAILGSPTDRAQRADADDDGISVMETNVDDITGELAGFALEKLLGNGALDAWATPIHMKKGRPALKLSALVRNRDIPRIGALLLGETTTIGVRHYPVDRLEMRREIREVDTAYGRLRAKLCFGPEGSVNAAPEYEDAKRLAEQAGAPLKRVMAAALGACEALIRESYSK